MKNHSVKKSRALISFGIAFTLGPLGLANAMLSTSVNGVATGGRCASTGTTFAGCNVPLSGIDVSGFPFTGTLGAIAVAGYEGLFAGTLVTATGNIGFYDTATAMSLDTLTILGGSGPGYVRFTYDVHDKYLSMGNGDFP